MGYFFAAECNRLHRQSAAVRLQCILNTGADTNMSKRGVGIIGTGERGCFILGARLAELAAETGFTVTALCDRLPNRLAEAESFLKHAYREQNIHIHPALYTDYRGFRVRLEYRCSAAHCCYAQGLAPGHPVHDIEVMA